MGGAQLLTPAERALFRDDYGALGLGLQIYGVSRPPRPARFAQDMAADDASPNPIIRLIHSSQPS